MLAQVESLRWHCRNSYVLAPAVQGRHRWGLAGSARRAQRPALPDPVRMLEFLGRRPATRVNG